MLAHTITTACLILVTLLYFIHPHPTPQCNEDEVIVWSRHNTNQHDTCVALDDMYFDPTTQTVHWHYSDERPTN